MAQADYNPLYKFDIAVVMPMNVMPMNVMPVVNRSILQPITANRSRQLFTIIAPS
jgi:hypothetical protein